MPYDNLVEFGKCEKDINDRRLFIVDCAVRWMKWCTIKYIVTLCHLLCGVANMVMEVCFG